MHIERDKNNDLVNHQWAFRKLFTFRMAFVWHFKEYFRDWMHEWHYCDQLCPFTECPDGIHFASLSNTTFISKWESVRLRSFHSIACENKYADIDAHRLWTFEIENKKKQKKKKKEKNNNYYVPIERIKRYLILIGIHSSYRLMSDYNC